MTTKATCQPKSGPNRTVDERPVDIGRVKIVDGVEQSNDCNWVGHREDTDLRRDRPSICLDEFHLVLQPPDRQSDSNRDRVQSRQEPVETFRPNCNEEKLDSRIKAHSRHMS